jgi:hypothetical protein
MKGAPFDTRTLLEVVDRVRSPVKKSSLRPLPALCAPILPIFPKQVAQSGPDGTAPSGRTL